MAIEQLSNNEGKESLGKEDLIEKLGEDDDVQKDTKVDEEGIKEDEDGGETEGKDDEDEEAGIKLADEDEDEKEDTEDVELVAPFKKADIEKDFPGIFKKYPYLEKAYYTERAYRDVFATPEDAQEAAGALETLQEVEESLLEGNASDLISRVKEYDENSYAKLIDNYLPSLQKVDPEAHNHVVGGIVKNLITLLAREARSTENDELRRVALAINKFVFHSEEYEPHKKLAVETKEGDKLTEERREFVMERFEVTQEELQDKVDTILESTILQNIDVKGVLTDFVKKHAVKDAMVELQESLERDRAFRKQLDRLWERAFASNFNRDSTKAIKAAYLSKARVLLKPVITRARNEALKAVGKRVRDDSDSDTGQKAEQRPFYKGTRGSTTSDKGGQKKADTSRGMSTLEFLNKD